MVSAKEAPPVTPGPESAPATQTAVSGRTDSESDYQAFIQRNLMRNYVAHVLHGLLGQTGFRLVNAPTFLPAYVLLLSGSEFVVGLARSIQYLGMFLSPLIAASLIEHRRRVLPIGFIMGSLMRVQVLGLALAGLFLAPDRAVQAICVFLFFLGFFMGMQGVIFNYLMSKVIPVKRRGRLLGLRNALAGITAATVAYLGGEFLVGENFLGDGYAATFLLAFALTTLGLAMLLLVREPQPPEVRPPSPLRERLRDLPALFREDRAYTYYFLCRALATMGRMATPFYIVYARDTIGLTGTTIGLLSTAFVAANSVSNLAWGAMGDRTGFRQVFVVTLVLWILSVLGMIVSDSLSGFVLAFIGIGAGMGGFQMAAQNMVLEFGSREDLPVRIAVANSAQEAVGAIGPLLGGLLAVTFGLDFLFTLAIGFQVAAIALVLFRVDEPRHRVT
ncbi:MAG TPA: MFS transporter [Myxococcales bacterium]|nr:MFS transporter [Myxococcales bacterium]HIL00549.1 MFS transporter [Myxococcales bacterium]